MTQVNPQQLEQLVDELMKDEPNKTKIKKLMSDCGMVYSTDYLTQVNTVLQNLSQNQIQTKNEATN